MLRKAPLLSVVVVALLAVSANAALIGISSTTPTVDGADIANLAWLGSHSDKTWTDTANQGQSFTTSSAAGGYTLSGFSMQVNTASSTDPLPADKVWTLRVVTIAANNSDSTTVLMETGHTSVGSWAAGDWFTWTLDTPLTLSPDTLYGIDVEMTSGGAWNQGIPYMRYNRADDVSGGYRYTRTDGDPAIISASTSWDRLVHIDLVEVPEPASLALIGLGGLMIARHRKI